MAEGRVQRRLAAILAADVVGYSRLMREDEAGTRTRFNAQLDEVVRPAIDERRGRLVKTMGDGFLVEFGSVVDAVQCATDIQNGVAARQNDHPVDRKMLFRIGVHLGDVIVEGADIHGDGVNIAARLEELAEPGGTYISDDTFRQVRGKLGVAFDDLGEHEVKNIAEPIRVYAVRPDPAGAPAAGDMGIAGKSSIAVLPFDNLSGDPEQDFIGEGLAEDIITGLARIRSFFVIARNSTFQYKGRSPDVRQIAKDLGVRYVVEGSVRRAGDRLRVTAQLIDGATGNHLWAERYDREFEDLFAIQDEITQRIVAQLEPELGRAEYERVKARPTEHLDAWELYHRGMAACQRWTMDDNIQARRLFEKAIERDPDFSAAYAGASWTYTQEAWFGSPLRDIAQAVRTARRAVALDDKDGFAHLALGRAFHFQREPEAAVAECIEATRINPNSAQAHAFLGVTLLHAGRAEEAIPHLVLATQLSPSDPEIGVFMGRLSGAYFLHGDNQLAIDWARKAVRSFDRWLPRAYIAAALGHLGRAQEARTAIDDLEAVYPGITIETIRDLIPFYPPYLEHLLEGLRKAGLPETSAGQDEVLALPDKPSIAVLPFANMSGDPEQEYFADGITEDIITALSRIRQFFVIARNTTFTYKDHAVDIQAVARDLGVRYVLEGSVRKAGDRVRVTAQLIDGTTGNHLWAERYDRDVENIFAVQDEITLTVVGAMEPELSRAEQERARRKPPESVDAWDLYQRGIWHLWRRTREDNAEAQRLLKQAVERDPDFCAAHAHLAYANFRAVTGRYTADPEATIDDALTSARNAVAADDGDALAHWALGGAYLIGSESDFAIDALKRAIELNPSLARAHLWLSDAYAQNGQPEHAIECSATAMRLSPNDPLSYAMLGVRAVAHFQLDQFEEAVTWSRRATRQPNAFLIVLLASLGFLNRASEAPPIFEDLKGFFGGFSEDMLGSIIAFRNESTAEKLREGLRRAGVLQ